MTDATRQSAVSELSGYWNERVWAIVSLTRIKMVNGRKVGLYVKKKFSSIYREVGYKSPYEFFTQR